MAKTVIVKLTDDLDGSEAEETIVFALDGRSHEIDLNKKNAADLRNALDPYIRAGRSSERARTSGRASISAAAPTLFSQLDPEEKGRFRAWAKLPDARRIRDSRVKEWIEAGRP